MQIDEKIVIEYPPSLRRFTGRQKAMWAKHRMMTSLFDLRRRLIKEKGVDIFNLYVMTDCIEFSLKGDIEAGKVNEIRPGRKKGILF